MHHNTKSTLELSDEVADVFALVCAPETYVEIDSQWCKLQLC